MSEELSNPNFQPDTLEAYQELRTVFSEVFETHSGYVQEWHSNNGSYSRGFACLSKYEGFVIEFVHMPEYAEVEFDGYINLEIGDQSHQFGILENGNLILYRHVNYGAHGLGLCDYAELSSTEEEGFYANISLEFEMAPPLPADTQTIKELLNLLRDATPILIQ